MELLLDLSRKVAQADNLDSVLQTIVATAATETHSDRGTLFLNDERTGELYSRVTQGGRILGDEDKMIASRRRKSGWLSTHVMSNPVC